MENILSYARQSISEDDIEEVVKVLKSNCITQGPKLKEFEEEIAKKVNSKYTVAVNSATSALHIACLSLNLKPGDCVWTSSISFVASANCALYCGAKVDFVDIDIETALMSIEHLESKLIEAEKNGTLPKVVIPVHLGGTSCNMQAISKLSKKYEFKIIEDASHAIGGKYQDSYVGSCEYSDITIFSFHPVKIITTAEGGMALTNNEDLAKKMEKLRGHGIVRNGFIEESPGQWYYEQQDLGYNYRMNEIEAALGLSQLKRLDYFVKRRNELVRYYKEHLTKLDNLELLMEPSNTYSSYHLAVVRLINSTSEDHKNLFNWMRSKNVWVQLHYWPIHLQLYYKKLIGEINYLPNSEKYGVSCFSIPLHPELKDYEQEYVINRLNEGMKMLKTG